MSNLPLANQTMTTFSSSKRNTNIDRVKKQRSNDSGIVQAGIRPTTQLELVGVYKFTRN